MQVSSDHESVAAAHESGFHARRLLQQARAGSSKASKSTASSDGWGFFVGDTQPPSAAMHEIPRVAGASAAAQHVAASARQPSAGVHVSQEATAGSTSPPPTRQPANTPTGSRTQSVGGRERVPTLQLPDLGSGASSVSRSDSSVSDAARLGSRVSSLGDTVASSALSMTGPFSPGSGAIAPGTPVVIGLMPKSFGTTKDVPSALEL